MDPENNANATTDPRAHVMSDSVDDLPAGLFVDDGDAAPNAGEAARDSEAVGLDTGEAEQETDEERAAAEDAGNQETEDAVAAEEAAATDANDAPPEFWSAEDKAAWASVPAALRPLFHKIDKQRVQFEQEKAREAAQVRKEAAEQGKQAQDHIAAGAQFWQANGPKFFQAFGDKWAGVDWVKLAEEDPARCQSLRMQQEHEAGMLRQAHAQGQKDIEATNQRAQVQLRDAKVSEHEKLVTKVPEFFGTAERATKTYDELGKFLFSKGIPADRINGIYEAPIIEMALNAMRFEKAQKQASTVVNRDETTGKFTAKTAPTKRVQPGPALREAGDRNADAARRAGERFRKGNGADVEAAAEYARINNLFG